MDQNCLVEILLPNNEFSYALYGGLSSLFTIQFNLKEKVGKRDIGIRKECERRNKIKTKMLISVMSGNRIFYLSFLNFLLLT